MKRYLIGTVLVLGVFVAGSLDMQGKALESAAQCTNAEVLVETLATKDNLIEQVWACVPIDSVRPVGAMTIRKEGKEQ